MKEKEKQEKTNTCKWCGKPIPKKNVNGKKRKYCSIECRRAANKQKNKEKSLRYWEDDRIDKYKYRIEDYYNRYENYPEFHQNDNNWGLGESFLTEHAFKDKTQEEYYIKKEMKRIFGRKKN